MNQFFYKFSGLRKCSAILVLLVFTLGITPKKTLHNWFANHTDQKSSGVANKTSELSKAGFNCQCDNLVAESHFIASATVFEVKLPSVYFSFYDAVPTVTSLTLFDNNLRGPPAKI